MITLHNLHFYLNLLAEARRRIEDGSFNPWRREFVANYRAHNATD
jgi:queuine tRNA-ribosyltransferase